MNEKNATTMWLVSVVIALLVVFLLFAELLVAGNPFVYLVIGMSVFKMGIDGYRNNKTGVALSGAIIFVQILLLLQNYTKG